MKTSCNSVHLTTHLLFSFKLSSFLYSYLRKIYFHWHVKATLICYCIFFSNIFSGNTILWFLTRSLYFIELVALISAWRTLTSWLSYLTLISLNQHCPFNWTLIKCLTFHRENLSLKIFGEFTKMHIHAWDRVYTDCCKIA